MGQYAQSVVNKLGMPEPRPLSDDERVLQLPENLADCDTYTLSHLMTGFAAMQNFADYQSKILFTDLCTLDARVESMVDQILPQVRAATIAEKKAKARTFPKVTEVAADADAVRAVYERVTTLRDIYGRCYQTVSREITRRQGMVEP